MFAHVWKRIFYFYFFWKNSGEYTHAQKWVFIFVEWWCEINENLSFVHEAKKKFFLHFSFLSWCAINPTMEEEEEIYVNFVEHKKATKQQ